MSGAEHDYKFGPKNNWRRWLWNRIIERLSVPPKDATVLYLAGEADRDRDEALRRGFQPNNLIAVERDQSVIAKLRAKGVLVVDADFVDCLRHWPQDRSLSVIIGDFCCGLTKSLWCELPAACFYPQANGAVCAFNFMRGRDGHIKGDAAEFRKTIDESWHLSQGPKHRANMFFTAIQSHAVTWTLRHRHPELFTDDGIPLQSIEHLMPEVMRVENYLRVNCRPVFNNYRSTSGQDFDSLVFKSPLTKVDEKLRIEFRRAIKLEKNHASVVRQISPILAHRTMRFS